jgi:predicted Zn-dependent protease
MQNISFKRNLLGVSFFTIFCFFPISFLYTEDISFDLELQAQIQRTSDVSYKNYIKGSGGEIKDHNGWREIIVSTFRKLSEKSGHESFPIVFSIIRNNEFNAFAYPTGQFIIHTGALDYIDKEIGSLPDKEKTIYRTNYISAILSHELAHYYNRHTYNSIKKSIEDSGDSRVSLVSIKFQQDDELDADTTAFLLLKKSGYDTSYFIKVLKILNKMRQDSLEANKNSPNKVSPYFSTHPSPHERLSHLESDEQELHKFAATMEKVYGDIQLGKNLQKSIDTIKKALLTYEDNPELLKALAIAYHKMWEQSVTQKDLQVKSIIDIPAFRDKMIFVGGESKKSAVKKIPGDKNLYYKALETYRKVYNQSPENFFLSNYSVLLSYAESEKDEKEALNIASTVYASDPSIQYANNLGVVHLITRNPTKALEWFRVLAKSIDSTLVNPQNISKETLDNLKKMQSNVKLKVQLDPDYVEADFSPILNLALIEFDYGDKGESKKIASNYLTNYESQSKWAQYLSEKTDTKIIPDPESEGHLEINGIKSGDTLKNLLSKWKAPDRKETLENEEIWYYSLYDAKIILSNGIITEIELSGKNSPDIVRANSKLTIGMTKALAEEVLGTEPKKLNVFHLYNRYGSTAVNYRQNKIKSIILYK